MLGVGGPVDGFISGPRRQREGNTRRRDGTICFYYGVTSNVSLCRHLHALVLSHSSAIISQLSHCSSFLFTASHSSNAKSLLCFMDLYYFTKYFLFLYISRVCFTTCYTSSLSFYKSKTVYLCTLLYQFACHFFHLFNIITNNRIDSIISTLL